MTEIFELLKRLVVAIERVGKLLDLHLQAAMEKSSGCGCHKPPAQVSAKVEIPLSTENPPDPKPEPEGAITASDMDWSKVDDRDVLVEACARVGIDTKRLQVPTLQKKLTEYYAAKEEPLAADPEPTPVESEPMTEVVEPSDTKVTKEMALEALQQVQKVFNNEKVFEILRSAGGVELFKDLPEDKYSAVHAAAVEALKGAK